MDAPELLGAQNQPRFRGMAGKAKRRSSKCNERNRFRSSNKDDCEVGGVWKVRRGKSCGREKEKKQAFLTAPLLLFFLQETYHIAKKRYFFRNLLTGNCKWDEPPSGATHIWWLDSPDYAFIDPSGDISNYAAVSKHVDVFLDAKGSMEAGSESECVENEF